MNKIKNRIKKIASQEETRTYKLSSNSEFLDKIEQVLTTMEQLSINGSSASIEIFVDGDGAFKLKVDKEDGELNKLESDFEKEKFNFDLE